MIGSAMNTPRVQEEVGSSTGKLFAPCRAACPVHINVPGYITAIGEGRFTDALETVLERNPLPSVCGRVCLRPCEEGCRRCQLDQPVAIASLKRAAADHGAYPAVLRPRRRPESVAIVGGGPAGLSAAHDLAELGLGVTIFESKPKLGGMLRYGIPNYRLPDEALDRDIDHILEYGIEVETGVKVGTDIAMDELRERFDAVLVTAGLQASRPLPIPGSDLPGVLTALPFLADSACGEDVELAESVIVIGGGNVAMDVARTARRQGAKRVDLICLESAQEMPASDEEIAEAELEGVRIHCSWGPREVLGEDKVMGLRVTRCTSVFDVDKRFSPTFNEDNVQEFYGGTVIFAIGQGADVADLGLPLTQRGAIDVDPLSLTAGSDRCYAAGDVVSGPTKVIDAIAAGKRAAALIYRDLTGVSDIIDELDEEHAVLSKVPDAMGQKLETRRRVEMERVEFYDAVKNFDEVELGYTEYEAAREAQRCLSCTTGARLTREKCAACLTCMRVCPHGAPSGEVGGYLYFDADLCHACGACASQCPAHAIQLEGCNDAELQRRVDRCLFNPELDTTLAFVCGYTPDLLDVIGEKARIISVPCLLRVSEAAVLDALQSGAHRVVFSGCNENMCRFPNAMPLVAARVARIKSLHTEIGMEDAFDVSGEEPAEVAAQGEGVAEGGAAS
ncbi:MAG: FAD-dependent oxidoreductase [Coriobacteriales bacterium]|nr:FAD-dependent oxidoreductase [Coriobacteriales bacterium]